MPRRLDMGWDGPAHRWTKMIDGLRYVVSCRQLKKGGYLPPHAPETKEASYQAANAWLRDLLGMPQPCRFQGIVDVLEKRLQVCEEEGWTGEADRHKHLLYVVRELAKDDTIGPEGMWSMFVEPSNTVAAVWDDRLRRRTHKDGVNKSTPHWIGLFLSLRQSEVEAGQLSHSAYRCSRACLESFAEWLGNSVDVLNSQKWVEWYQFILSKKYSYDYSKKLLSYARSFSSWLVEQGAIPSFEALHSRRYRFSDTKDDVITLPVTDIRQIIGKAQGHCRLFCLTMLNTGMTQKDLSDLKVTEYDGQRINRRRSKTRKLNTRAVSWLLWPETRDMIEEYRQDSGVQLLLQPNGTPWVTVKKDRVASLWRSKGFSVPLKRFRQASGDFIQHQFNRDVADHFLAHGQDPVDAAYYSKRQQELDSAVMWLRSLFFGA